MIEGETPTLWATDCAYSPHPPNLGHEAPTRTVTVFGDTFLEVTKVK